MDHDAFICHASEDKESFVRALAHALENRGIKVWYDEFSLKVGDSLRRTIDEALGRSKFGIVVLSKAFFAKSWPQSELDGLDQLEQNGDCKILPIRHGITATEVRKYSPRLADKFSISTDIGVERVAEELLGAINSSIPTHPSRSPAHTPPPASQHSELITYTKKFHDDRLAAIAANETPVELGGGAKLVLHVVPAVAAEDIGLSAEESTQAYRVMPIDSGTYKHFTTPWGIVNYGVERTRQDEQTYALIFPNGAIEAVDLDMLRDERGRGKILNSNYIEDKIVEFIYHTEHFLDQVKLAPPFCVSISLTGIRGYEGLHPPLDGAHPLTVDAVHLPPCLITEVKLDDPSSPGDYLKKAFDGLARAAGWNGSRSYPTDGSWHSKLGF